MAELGFRTINEMIGRSDKIEMRQAVDHLKAKGLDYSRCSISPRWGRKSDDICQIPQNHGLENALDNQVLLDLAAPALERGEKVEAKLDDSQHQPRCRHDPGQRSYPPLRTARIARRHHPSSIRRFGGTEFRRVHSAGHDIGARRGCQRLFRQRVFRRKVILYPPEGSTFVPEENMIVGNVAFYGATNGEAYIRGMAGERFCVRNSGVRAVVEGVGDHACEYMTGGRVVIIGKTGRNFAAGMSGGIAYVLDEDGTFKNRCNFETIALERLDGRDLQEVEEMLKRHAIYTRSARAWQLLALWQETAPKFVKVMPRDYRRVLEALQAAEAKGLVGDDALMAAFEANKNDAARVSGN